MNTCSLSGRLTWDPELRYQANGHPELSFRISVPTGEKDGTRFYLPFDVTMFGRDCEPLAESLVAGDLVELTGQNAWPKAPRKPGGKWIPAAICFGVTKLAGPVLTEHEHAPEYGSGSDAREINLAPASVPHGDDAHEPGPQQEKRPRLKTHGPPWPGKRSALN